MTGSRQVAKPAHAGRSRRPRANYSKESVKHLPFPDCADGRFSYHAKARLFLHWLCRPLRAGRGREMLPAAVGTAPLNRWNFKLPALNSTSPSGNTYRSPELLHKVCDICLAVDHQTFQSGHIREICKCSGVKA